MDLGNNWLQGQGLKCFFFQALSLRQVEGDLLSNPRTQRKTLQGSVSFIHVVGSEALSN